MGGDQSLWLHLQRGGAGDQVWLVAHQEIQHLGQHHGVAQPLTQFVGGDAGQRQQAFRVVLVGQHPAERGQCQRVGIIGGLRIAKNCQLRGLRVERGEIEGI